MKITLKDINTGEETIVTRINDSDTTNGIDGHTQRTSKFKWVDLEDGSVLDFEYFEQLNNAELGKMIGRNYEVSKID